MYPVSGAFSTFGSRFVSPSLGFTLGEFVASKPTLLIMISRVELLAPMVFSRNTDGTILNYILLPGACPYASRACYHDISQINLLHSQRDNSGRSHFTSLVQLREFFFIN